MKVKENSEKVGLKLNIQKIEIMASGPITSWQIDGETMETVTDFTLEFSRQEHWIQFAISSPEDLPNPGIKPASSALAGGFLTTELPGNPQSMGRYI